MHQFRTLTTALLSTVLGAACFSAQANRYVISDLGTGMSPVAINRVGAVAANDYPPHRRGELLKGGRWHNLSAHSQVSDINRAANAVGIDSDDRPVFWRHNSDASVIQVPQGGSGVGYAYALNNVDDVVGWYQSGDGSPQCFMWTLQGGAVDFGANEQWKSCVGYDVNSMGQITGQLTPQGESARAFLWAEGKFTVLDEFDDAISASGLAVNDSGEVVGLNNTASGSRAFLWNGALVDLDATNRFTISVAASINNVGDIVGWVQGDNSAEPAAVRFSHAEVLKLAPEVLNLGGWSLTKATAINDKGVIVGVGKLAGLTHAFRLTPQ